MKKIVGISFENNKQIYYFDPKNFDLKRNITVIVETERGLQFGNVELPPFEVSENKITTPLKSVVRISSKKDYIEHKKNLRDSQKALDKCRELINKYNLNMQIIDASFNFDRSQLLFRFVSDNRIDFRNLAKELANRYKTRIELRQIGVRDKAKEVGGCGLCGNQLCCSKFGCDFTSVSINMAKNQNISLNPNKINGVCGRLLCCLKYEDDYYKECRTTLPKIGQIVKTQNGEGKVISLDIINKKYTVNVPDVGQVEVDANGSN
jgi:cell fate regulator YaaT (PSP1 superfamily)